VISSKEFVDLDQWNMETNKANIPMAEPVHEWFNDEDDKNL
jgi:hypothetical protein